MFEMKSIINIKEKENIHINTHIRIYIEIGFKIKKK